MIVKYHEDDLVVSNVVSEIESSLYKDSQEEIDFNDLLHKSLGEKYGEWFNKLTTPAAHRFVEDFVVVASQALKESK